MNIEIRRFRIRGECCDSCLYVNGDKVCDCTENATHHTPEGTYHVDLRFARDAHRKVPTLIPADDNSQVRRGRFPIIKVGNGALTLKNQIIVGTRLIPGVLIHSREAFNPLYDRINNAMRRGKEVWVTITDVNKS